MTAKTAKRLPQFSGWMLKQIRDFTHDNFEKSLETLTGRPCDSSAYQVRFAYDKGNDTRTLRVYLLFTEKDAPMSVVAEAFRAALRNPFRFDIEVRANRLTRKGAPSWIVSTDQEGTPCHKIGFRLHA